jgi:hypothetical protein
LSVGAKNLSVGAKNLSVDLPFCCLFFPGIFEKRLGLFSGGLRLATEGVAIEGVEKKLHSSTAHRLQPSFIPFVRAQERFHSYHSSTVTVLIYTGAFDEALNKTGNTDSNFGVEFGDHGDFTW